MDSTHITTLDPGGSSGVHSAVHVVIQLNVCL